ncbi:hypothetical protein GCM10010833_08180 [Blastomonas aquatica]|uniref:Uncharacterized protein n=1 Tax=Blastomonas aquatica TaxID=1510276 RepID=A0ABQ1IYW7_9SPHN|nr:hypothetical protein GCM10010833_08180 [Blastomonas aquatica]
MAGQWPAGRDNHQVENIAEQLQPLSLKFCGVQEAEEVSFGFGAGSAIKSRTGPVSHWGQFIAWNYEGKRHFEVVRKQADPVQCPTIAQHHVVTRR